MNGLDIVGGILYGMAMAMPPPPQYYHTPPRYYTPTPQYAPAPQYVPPSSPVAYSREYNCTPPLDGSINPVTQILIALGFDNQNQFLAMKVVHKFRNGDVIERRNQYSNAQVTFQEGIYGWKGNYNRAPNWVMAGGMYQSGDLWYYREKQWKDQTPSFDLTTQCFQYAGPPSVPAPAPTPVIPPKATGLESLAPQPGWPKQPTATPTPVNAPPPIAQTIKKDMVPIYSGNGGVMVDVLVGGHPVRMLLDTGASLGTISKDLAVTLVREGNAEYVGKGQSVLADGSTISEHRILIKEYRIGSHVVRNVLVSASDGGMLLGFKTLNTIGPFTIDTRNNQLVFNGG